MRNSGCEVPEYMLQMKITSKSEAKKMVRKVPTRKSISTEPLPDKIKRKKRERIIANARKKTSKGDVKKIVRKVPTEKTNSTKPLPDKIKRKKRERIVANVRKTKQNGQQGSSAKKRKIMTSNVKK